MPEFEDWEALKLWLREQPQEMAAVLAVRCALRGVPGLFQASINKQATTALMTLRTILCASVAAKKPELHLEEIVRQSQSRTFGLGHYPDASTDPASALVADAAAHAATLVVPEHEEPSFSHPNDSIGFVLVNSAHAATFSTGYDTGSSKYGSDQRTSLLAIEFDTKAILSGHEVWNTALWPSAMRFDWPRPNSLAELAEDLPVWGFWARWYDGFLRGDPLDWEVQRRIALVASAEWEAGPERIAEMIAAIEDQMRAERVEAARLQAAALKARSVLMITVASGLSAQIEMALAEWATVSNALPEELEPLERFQGLCDGIAASLKADAPEDEIAELIVAMAGTIGELNRRLAATRAELRASAARPSPADLRRAGFHTRLGERTAELITSKLLWGGIFAGATMLLGPTQTDAIGSLGQCYEDMIGPDAIYPPEMWAVPDYSEA